MKRLLFLFSTLLLFGFAGMRGAGAVEITVLYPQPYLYQAPVEEIVKAFAAKRPDIQVKLLAPTKAYEETASAVLRGAVTGSMPDIAFNGTNLMHLFVDRKLAVPLDGFVAKEADWEKQGYVPGMISTGLVNGKLYGMPFALSTPILYFNADLLRKAGGDPALPPKTWPELLALARRVTDAASNTHGAYMVWTTTGNYLWQELLFTHDGQMLSTDGKKVGFDTPAGLKTFEILRDLVKEGGMPNLTDEQATQAFIAGQIGFYMSSSARVNSFTNKIGSRFELGTAPFPSPRPDSKIVSGGATMMIFAKDLAKQAAAWEFIKFAAGPIGQTIMVRHIGYMPSNQIAIDTPELLGNYYANNPNMRTAISQRARTTAWLGFPGENSLKAIQVIYDVMESVVAGKATPEDALKRSVTQVQALLPK
ncbi:MAG: ABC transporter substrate-binding protein [Reyranella sp.]|uniref:ABC transporter substrate-binding protein n=1 Tax=Reyranella sp. TaxID=1929291 RepID=UPI00122BA3F5|nr:ABC transporter substrate-binding protein [Reyranella sp.]TAJ87765.1 MAG: ABC transporter substrate-binding protein [Reyranella sp.]